jgi:hypothetical protein
VLTIAALSSGACAPMLMGGGYAQQPPALGRWDQVMTLRPNWIVEVLDAEGVMHNGRFIRASVRTLRISTSAGEIELPRADVIRVELLDAQDGADTGKNVAVGAATGALALGGGMALIPYLATGKVILPPARFFGLGAAMGAVDAAQRDRHGRRPRTVYIAPLR